MCEMLQSYKAGIGRTASQSAKGQGLVCCHTEQFSQRGPRDEGSQGS